MVTISLALYKIGKYRLSHHLRSRPFYNHYIAQYSHSILDGIATVVLIDTTHFWNSNY